MFGAPDDQYQYGQGSDPQADASAAPADDTMSAPATDMAVSQPTSDDGMSGYEPTAAAPSDGQTHHLSADTPEELISIKQEALQNLKPLVGHLEQTPEEKFRTTMMMIQASDDQSLIPDAYDAAKAIADDKVRAQALLDVVNEINYFTAQHGQQ